MALSNELLKRLNSNDYPLAKRLKLAETAFCEDDLLLISKEDFLLEWLCKTCAMNQHAWKELNNCLKFNHINIRADIKQSLIDMLIQTLEKNNLKSTYDEVLECCSLIFVNNSMRQYFITKPKILGLLIKTVFNNVLKHSNYNTVIQKKINQLFEPYKLSPVESNAVITIIESLMQIYKQLITTKDELRLTFIWNILYPMCILVDHTHIDNTNQLGIAAYKCIQQLLLGKNRSVQNKQTEESCQSMFSDLFCMLSENINTSNLQSNLLTYQFIFRTVIGTYKSDTILLDTFLRNLVNSSGKYKWEILDSFLKLLNDITLDFDNIIEGITLTEYFQNFISEILTDDVTCVQYRILTQLSYINPLLIEKNISNIINKILMKEQTVDHTNLLIAILYTSTKLRREQKFISQLLISLKQHVATKETYKANISVFFPSEFKIQLIKAISNFSNSQTIATLRTLIYYLNTDCAELLQSNTLCKNIMILKVTVELLIICFEGMQVFEYTRILSAHEKFINCLDEIGNALSLLVNKSLCLSHNKTVIIILLSAVHSLNKIQNMFTYYILKDTVPKKLLFPILDDPWQQLIQRITNFGEDNCKDIMNKLILYRLKLNISNKPIKLHGLIGDLEYFWSTILKHDIDILSLLHDKEISKVTYLLLTDIQNSTEHNFHEWLNILDKECLQENKYLIMCFLSHILVQIGHSFSLTITEYINIKLLMENGCNDKLLEVLQILKKQISQEQWMQMANTISFETVLYLEILLHLPIIYFSTNVRTLIFLIVYFISKKCGKNDKVSVLCNMIFSDLLEKTGIDLFQYIEPKLLVNQLAQNKIFSKACEFSLRNVRTYATLKNLIKSCIQCKETICIILECMEIIKPKLDAEQKVIFKKAEKKLVKIILKSLPEHINDAFDVKCLIAVLKMTFQTGKITDTLKRLTEATLKNIFTAKEKLNNTNNDKLLQQSMQLFIIVLQHRKMFEIENMIINLWFIMLKHPHKNLIKLLLTSSELKEFCEFLRLLHDETIHILLQKKDEVVWTNIFVVWSNIMKIDMNVKRNKVRLNAINNLFETILTLDMPHRYWSELLCLSHDIISAKHLLIPDITIDLIILISLKSLDEVNISSCKDVLTICRTMMKVKTDLITDKLPNLLLLYRRTINIIVHASKSIINKFDEHRFRCYALDITKLTNVLVKLKTAMVRLAPYVIADLLLLIVEGTIPSYVKMALHESLCQLISICDQHGLAFLSRTLPTSSQEVFKVQLNTFKKFYKYSGKI